MSKSRYTERNNLINLRKNKIFSLCLSFPFIISALVVSGCAPPPQPDTGLYGKATHTGTLYVYRVPPIDLNSERKPQFSPLRGSMDLGEFVDGNGVFQPELHVTEDDLITVSLSSAFLKYIPEEEGDAFVDGEEFANDSVELDKRQGEIVMVMSFDAGTSKRESFVVFSSGGQTLGSFLSVQDWPLIGPMKVDSSDLKIRIVLIELDQAENEKIKQLTRSVGNTVGQLQPELAPVVKVAQPLIEAIIALNGDDVILDQRFALQRIDKASTRNQVHRMPLLFGKYVLVMQEDGLRDDDINTAASDAIAAPALSNMRFNLHNNRIYKTYDYWTDRWGWNANEDNASEFPTVASPDLLGPKILDLDKLYDLGGCPDDADFDYAEHPDAKPIRTDLLGYDSNRTTGIERWNCLEHALNAAYCEGLRGQVSIKEKSDKADIIKNYEVDSSACLQDKDEIGALRLNYPVTVYPTANVVLAQYPLHTNLVLTIEESSGGVGKPVHEVVSSLEEFNKNEIDSIKDGIFADKIGELLITAKVENRKQTVLLKKVKAEKNKNEKLCLLYDALSEPGKDNVLSTAPLYNRVYKISGEVLTTTSEIADYLSSEEVACTAETNCSCAASLNSADDVATTPEPQATLLMLTDPPQTGDAVKSLRTALKKAGFEVTDEDGTFGENTKIKVEEFQKSKGLDADGIAGENTLKELGVELG